MRPRVSPAYHASALPLCLASPSATSAWRSSSARIGRPDRSAARGAHDELRAGHRDRLADGGQRLRGERLHVVAEAVRVRAHEEQRELVRAGARKERLATLGDRAQAQAQLAQHLVACGMSEAVVDGLEAVDVDDQDGGELGLRRAAGDLLLQVCAVRCSRERVVVREMPQPVLVLPA